MIVAQTRGKDQNASGSRMTNASARRPGLHGGVDPARGHEEGWGPMTLTFL